MEDLVAFTSLTSDLNDEEYNDFMKQACKLINRRDFECAIFSILKRNPKAIVPFANMVNKIIKERASKSASDEALLNNTLSGIPRELISNVASFLNISDYHYFGRTNKNIYIACYSMVTLQKCNAYRMLDLPKQVRKRYLPKIKALKGNVELLNKLFNEYRPVFQRSPITSLSIQDILYRDYETIKILSNQEFDLTNVRRLTLDSSGGYRMYSLMDTIDCSRSICQMLKIAQARIPKLEYLSISLNNRDMDKIDVEKQCFPNLKGVKLCNVKNMEMIINAHSSQLEAICIYKKVSIKDQSFPKLVEVQDTDCSFNLNMFNNVTTIKRARICSVYNDSKEEIMNFIKLMMLKQNNLEHLSIECDLYLLHGLMASIKKLLFIMNNKSRKNVFHMELVFKTINEIEDAFSERLLSDIIGSVESMDKVFNNMDFALTVLIKDLSGSRIYPLNRGEHPYDLFEGYEAFKQKYFVQSFFYSRQDFNGYIINICNRGCKIAGFAPRYTFEFDKSVCAQKYDDDAYEDW